MSETMEYVQVTCPSDGSQQILELREQAHGTRATWCSRELTVGNCDQSCLKKFNRVAFLMSTSIPKFETSELVEITAEQALHRFHGCEFERLPVVNKGKLVGELIFRRILLDQTVEVSRKTVTVSLEENWKEAARKLVQYQRNEVFVVDGDFNLKGLVLARKLLEVSTA